MRAIVNGDIYNNNGRISVCYNPNGLLGNGRFRFQSEREFIEMVENAGGYVIYPSERNGLEIMAAPL